MRRNLLFLASITLALLITSISPSVGVGNYPQTTDAAANCKYGTSPLSEFQPSFPRPGEPIHKFFGEGQSDPCWLALGWNSEIGISFSYSAAFARANPRGVGTEVICSRASDPACDAKKFPDGQFRSLAGFYKCESDGDVNCIAQLTVIAPDGKSEEATFERYFPDVPQIPASDLPTLRYPKGGSPTLWSFNTPEGKKYIYASGVVERNFGNDRINWTGSQATFNFGLQAVNIFADPAARGWSLVSNNYSSPEGEVGSRVELSRGKDAPGLDGQCRDWLTMDVGFCLVQTPFQKNYRYRVTFQVQPDQAFFLNGRLDSPIAYTEPLGTNKRLVIEGAPATLFAVSGTIPKKYLTPDAVAAIKAGRDDFAKALEYAPSDFPPMETNYPDLLSALLPYFGDRTSYELQAWTLKSTPTLGRFTNQCINGGRGEILGIISTNATAFNGDPPVLDPATKILSYKVAAPHFAVYGKTESLGKYYMNMNANFIKCILGVDKVPAVAQIGITSSGQAERVSTVTVKTDKDWLRLNVDNFTFSSPKINVKFEAPADLQPVVQSPQATKAQPKIATKTITCIKGKTTKKISGTNPKCPSGYKKK